MSGANHPYAMLSDRAFWSRAVATGWNPRDLFTTGKPLVEAGDRIMSAGSCFARSMIAPLERAGYSYIRTESLVEDSGADRFGYGAYSASYGNIYTPRQFVQVLQRARGSFRPVEDRWYIADAVIDPFRPGLPYPADNDIEFDVLSRSHLEHVREAVAQATVFIFTLGLTEAWVSTQDGAVFPACPGTVAGVFDPDRHRIVNFTVSEVVQDLRALIEELRTINPTLRVILTVSPVPLVATTTGDHVLCATMSSKAVLRAACEELRRNVPDIVYFPAYELVVGPRAGAAFEEDCRTVSRAGIDAVMEVFFSHCQQTVTTSISRVNTAIDKQQHGALLSETLAAFECEELMADQNFAERLSR